MDTQVYSFSSNARRAARQAGLDPDQAVKPNPGGMGFIIERAADTPNDGLDMPESLMVSSEERAEARAKTPVRASRPEPKDTIIMPKAKSAKARKRDKLAKSGDKTELLVGMLKGKGATVEQLSRALDWLPHTLRARISGLVKPPRKLKIERERKDGVTSYRIAS